MARILLEDVRIRYGKSFVAVDDFDLEVGDGDFGVLLGPSGCGKSTLLNAVAGLVQPERGRISIGDKVVFDADAGTDLAPNLRDVGMVYQSYALWPHLSVFDNVAFPLKRRKVPRAQIRERVGEVLEQVHCAALADRYPNQLSGGQQQRISLARALAPRPQMMLMDEPLSNLDAELRRELREEIGRLHSEMGFSALYVTHDQQEALGLGDVIAVMNGGRIEQVTDPLSLYRRPLSVGIATFLGANTLSGDLVVAAGGPVVETAVGRFPVPAEVPVAPGPVEVALFPTSIELDPVDGGIDGPSVVSARFLGDRFEYLIETDGVTVRVVDRPLDRGIVAGGRVRLHVPPSEVHVYGDAVPAAPSTAPAVVAPRRTSQMSLA